VLVEVPDTLRVHFPSLRGLELGNNGSFAEQ